MSKTPVIQLKAAVLLFIFSMNMFVGFACAVGVNMGFNTTHLQDKEAKTSHMHAGGTKHGHQPAGGKHSHKGGKDDCCTDKVVKLSQVDKAVPQTAKLSPVFFTAFVATYYNLNITFGSQVNTSIKYFVLGHHPPIPDIRIAIQSFQI